jgi:pimeloyl-ACP methyl ester carboxylesterase
MITSTDGVRLAVQEHGNSASPTLVAIHGYPDNHTIWDGMVPLLSDRFHVVTYDVRGAGASDRPAARSAYRIEQLVEDFGAVIDAVSPGAPVHLLAHDWGSIQTWDALTEERFAHRVSSFTSVSGPSLDHAGFWMRGVLDHPRAALKQLLSSYYIVLCQLPWLPEFLARKGLVDTMVARSSSLGLTERIRPPAEPTPESANLVQLYRANFARRLLRPRPPRVHIPVLVIAPTEDIHVTVGVALGAPAPYVDRLQTRTIPGNHWMVRHSPEVIAPLVVEFIDGLATEASLGRTNEAESHHHQPDRREQTSDTRHPEPDPARPHPARRTRL